MDAYQRGLVSCGSSSGGSSSNDKPSSTSSNKLCNAVTGLVGESVLPGAGGAIGATAGQSLC